MPSKKIANPKIDFENLTDDELYDFKMNCMNSLVGYFIVKNEVQEHLRKLAEEREHDLNIYEYLQSTFKRQRYYLQSFFQRICYNLM